MNVRGNPWWDTRIPSALSLAIILSCDDVQPRSARHAAWEIALACLMGGYER